MLRKTDVEASSFTPSLPAPAPPPLAPIRQASGRWGLIIALVALPISYGIRDLTHGYQAGIVAGHPIVHHDLTRLGFNFAQGLSNAAIWALFAIGYTLVYGIIEQINFAHGDVFMIGSMTSVGLWGTLGLGLATGPLGLILGLLATLIVSMFVCGLLNVLIERVGYRPLRGGAEVSAPHHRGGLLLHPAERRAALERWLAVRGQRPDPPGTDGVQHLRRPHRARLPAGPRRDDPARVRAGVVHQQHPGGPGHAGHRAGSRGGAADGDQRQPD